MNSATEPIKEFRPKEGALKGAEKVLSSWPAAKSTWGAGVYWRPYTAGLLHSVCDLIWNLHT
jgi:hypothetical protein